MIILFLLLFLLNGIWSLLIIPNWLGWFLLRFRLYFAIDLIQLLILVFTLYLLNRVIVILLFLDSIDIPTLSEEWIILWWIEWIPWRNSQVVHFANSRYINYVLFIKHSNEDNIQIMHLAQLFESIQPRKSIGWRKA